MERGREGEGSPGMVKPDEPVNSEPSAASRCAAFLLDSRGMRERRVSLDRSSWGFVAQGTAIYSVHFLVASW